MGTQYTRTEDGWVLRLSGGTVTESSVPSLRVCLPCHLAISFSDEHAQDVFDPGTIAVCGAAMYIKSTQGHWLLLNSTHEDFATTGEASLASVNSEAHDGAFIPVRTVSLQDWGANVTAVL